VSCLHFIWDRELAEDEYTFYTLVPKKIPRSSYTVKYILAWQCMPTLSLSSIQSGRRGTLYIFAHLPASIFQNGHSLNIIKTLGTMALIYQKCVHQISSVHLAYTQNHGDFEIYQYGRWRTARSNPTPAQEVVYARFELVRKCAEKFLTPQNALTN